LVAIPLVILIIGTVKYSAIVVNEYHIQVPRKGSSLHHLKIALASDFHLKEITSKNFMPQFTATVNSLNVDVLFLPGDILEGDRQDEQMAEFERQFRSIRTKYGIYATLGNHEFYRRNVKLDFFAQSNITLLQDSVAVVDSAFTIVGRNDNHLSRRKTIDELMMTVNRTLPVIVLDHRPTEISQVSATGADVLLCGHTHHGQLFPFNYITESVYDLSWGYKKVGNTNVFVTSGIQLWGPPVRTAGDSEIMVISVDFTDN
jgi:predicted MPP superfamily phosphohydrolase